MTDKPNTATIAGRIIEIGDTQTFASGFTKRRVVVDTGGKYPQAIPVDFKKDRTAALDKCAIGDEVTIQADIGGREYNGRYYVDITGWRIEGGSGCADHETTDPAGDVPEVPAGDGPSDGPGDNLPF